LRVPVLRRAPAPTFRRVCTTFVTRSARALVLAPRHCHPEPTPRWLWVLIIILFILVFNLPNPEDAGAFFGNVIDGIAVFFRSFGESIDAV
jgi:hypothetical protein